MAQARRAKPRPSRVILPLAVAAALLIGGFDRRLAVLARGAHGGAEPHQTPAVAATESTAVPPTTPQATATPSARTPTAEPTPEPTTERRPTASAAARRAMDGLSRSGAGRRPRAGGGQGGDRPLVRPRRRGAPGRGREDHRRRAAGDFQADPAGRPHGSTALHRGGQCPSQDHGLVRQGRGRRRQDQDRDGQVPEAEQGAAARAGGGRGRDEGLEEPPGRYAAFPARSTCRTRRGSGSRPTGRPPHTSRRTTRPWTSSTPRAAERVVESPEVSEAALTVTAWHRRRHKPRSTISAPTCPR